MRGDVFFHLCGHGGPLVDSELLDEGDDDFVFLSG